MTETNLAFDQQLDKLADHIVQKATLQDTPFDESVDAFKALTTYYALRLKHKQADENTDETEFSFASGLGSPPTADKEQQNGGAHVRDRHRRPA